MATFPHATITPREAGVGLRSVHWQEMAARMPALGFLEVHSENFFCDGGPPLRWLERFRRDYPISTHGVGLSLGSADRLDPTHLRKLKRLVDHIEPALVSDHICWVGVDGRYLNDLLPLPYTTEALDLLVERVSLVQDTLGRQMLVENVSSYLEFAESTIPEWEFVRELAKRSGCRILLDVNNIHVNAVNHGIDAIRYIDSIELGSVAEIHLAGFQDTGEILIDTHGNRVCDAVWALYEHTLQRFGPVPTLIEWDTDIPALDVLLDEAAHANRYLEACAAAHPAQEALHAA